MALIRDLVLKRPLTLENLIKLEKNKVSLKPIKKLTIYFDPFKDDVKDIRKFASFMHEEDIVKTNPKCQIQTQILTDRSESLLQFDLTTGKQIIIKCANLKCLELFKLVNEHISSLAPKEEVFETPKASTKMVKKKA